MWLRGLGVLSATVLFTNGYAFCQDAGFAPGEGASSAAYDWLSPAPLAWAIPGFNWSDLPFKMSLATSSGYDSNILNVGTATPAAMLPGNKAGDYFLRNDIGASTRANVEGQQLFANLDYNTVDYLRDTTQNQHNHSFSGGVNWKLNSHCSGTLALTQSTAQAAQNEAASQGVDILTSTIFSDSNDCHLYQDIDVITGASASSIRHSLAVSKPLDSNAGSLTAGLQYSWGGIDSLELLLNYTNTKYLNSTGTLTSTSLPSAVDLLNTTLSYNYSLSPKLRLSLSGGFSQDLGATASEGGGAGSPLQPIYSVSLSYILSDKVNFNFSAGRSVSAPTSIIARTQNTTSESASLSYAWTPKVSLQASINSSSTTGATTTSQTNPSVFGNNNLIGVSLSGNYLITPFTSMTFAVSSSNRTTNGTNGTNVPTNIITIGLDYRPY